MQMVHFCDRDLVSKVTEEYKMKDCCSGEKLKVSEILQIKYPMTDRAPECAGLLYKKIMWWRSH